MENTRALNVAGSSDRPRLHKYPVPQSSGVDYATASEVDDARCDHFSAFLVASEDVQCNTGVSNAFDMAAIASGSKEDCSGRLGRIGMTMLLGSPSKREHKLSLSR